MKKWILITVVVSLVVFLLYYFRHDIGLVASPETQGGSASGGGAGSGAGQSGRPLTIPTGGNNSGPHVGDTRPGQNNPRPVVIPTPPRQIYVFRPPSGPISINTAPKTRG